ncbi:MAG: hypothetical protein MJB14_10185 [Spirochaetes bacterium]|nr:hypothetical protein [Spirochaetota bacterium]
MEKLQFENTKKNIFLLIDFILIIISLLFFIYSIKKITTVPLYTYLAIINGGFLVIFLGAMASGLLFKNKKLMFQSIIIAMYLYSLIFLVLTSFYQSIPLLVMVISLLLVYFKDGESKKKITFMITGAIIYLILAILQISNFVQVDYISFMKNSLFYIYGSLHFVFIPLLVYSFYLLLVQSQITLDSDFHKVVYEKSLSVDELNEKIYHLKKNLNQLETSEKGIFNTTYKILRENKKIMDYLEEYKMIKKDAVITYSVHNIDKGGKKILELLEHPLTDEKDDAASYEIALHTKTKVFELSISGYHYEIMLKGILYNIIHVLMDKLVNDIKNNVTNYDVRGLVERDQIETKVFGKICRNNRLNTNITRIRSLLASEGLTIDLIESKDSMVRINTISDKITIYED